MNVLDVIAQSLLDRRCEAIIAADRDGIICFWDPGAERIFGHLRGDAVGHALDLMIPERLRQRHGDGYRATIATARSRCGESDVLSVRALRHNATTMSVDFAIVPVSDEAGAMIGTAAIMCDVGERFEERRASKRRLTEATRSPPSGLGR